jgi:hypothetical protein
MRVSRPRRRVQGRRSALRGLGFWGGGEDVRPELGKRDAPLLRLVYV